VGGTKEETGPEGTATPASRSGPLTSRLPANSSFRAARRHPDDRGTGATGFAPSRPRPAGSVRSGVCRSPAAIPIEPPGGVVSDKTRLARDCNKDVNYGTGTVSCTMADRYHDPTRFFEGRATPSVHNPDGRLGAIRLGAEGGRAHRGEKHIQADRTSVHWKKSGAHMSEGINRIRG